MTTVHRLEALAHGVLGPMVLGGKLHLVPPFGANLALGIEGEPRIVDDDLRTHVDLARVRVARTLMPVDTLGDIPAADWALAAAWNDLLQATNHHLSGVFTRGRHAALLRSVEALVGRIAAPRSIGEAVARHATFARALELVRTDTKVMWWSGSARFRGEPVPPRLFSWKGVRRVRSEETRIAYGDLAEGVPVAREAWLATMGLWLARSPITDIATMVRGAPSFQWSTPSLSFVATSLGAKVAARALSRAVGITSAAAVTKALETSVDRMQPGRARDIALAFANEATNRIRGVAAQPAASSQDATPRE